MELMTDGSLRTLLYRRTQGQPWSLSLGLDLVRQAAEGLAAAHEKKVVHRDIKPDNLMLNRQSGQGQEGEQYVLKISDFGLARLAAGSGLTATGATMGTLTYMSPEQCQGGELDGRSDLYSLGIVLYEIAIGSPPFQIDNFEDAYNKHVNTPPPLPRQLRPDLPPSIEEIILRCLAKKPGERYATGIELAQALQRAMGDRGLTTIAPLRLPPMPSVLMKSTAFQASGAGGMPPPVVSTLLRPSKVPRVRVLDQSGKTLHVVEVTSAGFTIGRHPRNDIVLDAQGISRQHLRIQGDSRQVTVTDLGSSNGTWLGEQKLLPQVSQPWTEGKAVRIGPYWLRLEAPNAAANASMPGTVSQTQLRGAPPRQTRHTASMAGSGRIGMLVEPDALTITPGQPATTQVTLVNQGSIVDWFTVTVEGVAPEWVQGPAQTVQLNPGMEQAVTLNMNVARTANNRAGDYPVTIRARSREKPDESGTAQARWTVLPFQEDELGIEPRRASGRGKAAYTITMRNSGNIPAHHVLSGDDDEQKLAYGFGFNPVALEPGNETKIPLTVSTRRHWLGREQRQPFQIHARRAGSSSPMTTPGEFVNKALIPAWVLPVVGAVLAAAVILSSVVLLRAQGGPPGTPTPTPHPTIGVSATTTSQPTPDNPATAEAQKNATATAQANGSANATATAQANETATVVASTLYTADWSSGLNSWKGTSDWTVTNSVLGEDGTNSSLVAPGIVAPYEVTQTSDYAIEVEMQAVAGSPCFDISTIRASISNNEWLGYKAVICNGKVIIEKGNIGGSFAGSYYVYDVIAQTPFNPGNSWHKYRLEAKGTTIRLLIDDKQVLQANDSTYLSGGKLGLNSYQTQLKVKSFKVLAI